MVKEIYSNMNIWKKCYINMKDITFLLILVKGRYSLGNTIFSVTILASEYSKSLPSTKEKYLSFVFLGA